MDVYVTHVRYNDSYETTFNEVWFSEEVARNRCRMPLYHSNKRFEVKSYELYQAHLDAHTLLEKGGIGNV